MVHSDRTKDEDYFHVGAAAAAAEASAVHLSLPVLVDNISIRS